MTAAMATAMTAAVAAAAMTSSMTSSSCTGCGYDVVGGLSATSSTAAAASSTAAQQGQEGAIADAQRGQQTNEDLRKESGASASVIIQKEQLPLFLSLRLRFSPPLVLTFIAY